MLGECVAKGLVRRKLDRNAEEEVGPHRKEKCFCLVCLTEMSPQANTIQEKGTIFSLLCSLDSELELVIPRLAQLYCRLNKLYRLAWKPNLFFFFYNIKNIYLCNLKYQSLQKAPLVLSGGWGRPCLLFTSLYLVSSLGLAHVRLNKYLWNEYVHERMNGHFFP